MWGKPIIPPSDIAPANRDKILQELCQQAQAGLDDCMQRAETLSSNIASNS